MTAAAGGAPSEGVPGGGAPSDEYRGGDAPPGAARSLSWLGIVRLGLVQTALGAIFVLSTSTLNRVMKVELGLPAALPGLLIALQYWIQVLRPRFGHGSDVGGRRAPTVVGGMAVLAGGGLLAATATALMTRDLGAGLALATLAFAAIGVGVSAAGTALLTMLAGLTAPARRPAAATVAWVMMIAGFIVTAAVAGKLLDPFSPARLVRVAAIVAAAGFLLSCLAVWGVEGRAGSTGGAGESRPFRAALRDVWAERRARRFAFFVFVSMLAYGGEELMIEPFAGTLFGATPGQTAGLSGLLHAGSLGGMILVAAAGGFLARRGGGPTLRVFTVGGCLGSAAALFGLATCGLWAWPEPVKPLLFGLGLSNGAYAVAAIASMMQLVGSAGDGGTRMGLWGAAQGVAFGCGGLAATVLSDAVRHLASGQGSAYAAVFAAQAVTFAGAAAIAFRLEGRVRVPRPVAAGPSVALLSRRGG